jgi:RNA polymerase sigma factor (sigma-70 family)
VAAEACELAARVRAGMSDRERLLDELRPVSFAIAYPMLGSVSEAEDVVQEALLRVHQALVGGRQIASPRAFVATATTRLAINELRSARARREHYVGEWLPEPVITDGHDDPARHAEMADSLSLAMLVVLESLSPEQRAVLLLHDVFDYNHAQIAQIIGKSQDNVRQIATRARRHVEQRRPRFQTTGEQRDAVSSSKPITYPDLVDAWADDIDRLPSERPGRLVEKWRGRQRAQPKRRGRRIAFGAPSHRLVYDTQDAGDKAAWRHRRELLLRPDRRVRCQHPDPDHDFRRARDESTARRVNSIAAVVFMVAGQGRSRLMYANHRAGNLARQL